MRMSLGLSMQQQQRLVMTPELRQALAVLQLPILELGQYLEQEMHQNPLLELQTELEADDFDAYGDEADAGPDDDLPADWAEYFDDGPHSPADVPVSHDAGFWRQEVGNRQGPTLQEHLIEQLRLSDLPDDVRRAARVLVCNLDDNGWLSGGAADLGRQYGWSPELTAAALRAVQNCDPAGVGAADLRECLLLQWRRQTGGSAGDPGSAAALVPALIERHLEDIASGRLTRIAAELGVPVAVVQRAADLLRSLDPIPGRRFAKPGDVRYVVPDVTIERVGDEFIVLVNEGAVPRLAVNPTYRRLLRDSGDETREYLQRKLQSALWFLRSLEQRRLTLYRVAETIVDMQRDFFLHGVRSLRPLTLREVAAAIGVHESTVSRAVANKHAQTPHGIFELRFFFDSGIDGAIGGGLSAASIKRRLQELIDGEDRRQPLSDQQLSDLLQAEGIPISRRTVAKYREEMGLASSTRRRRFD